MWGVGEEFFEGRIHFVFLLGAALGTGGAKKLRGLVAFFLAGSVVGVDQLLGGIGASELAAELEPFWNPLARCF